MKKIFINLFKNKQLKKNKINFKYILRNLFKIKLISILKKLKKPFIIAGRSDRHQDKYEYNQTNYRNKEILHIIMKPF